MFNLHNQKAQRDEFIESNLGLVHSLAVRFKGRGVEYEELVAAGSVGLIKAVDRFEEERGLCFSTYAVPVILGEIKKIFRDGGTVKVSRSLKELSLKVNHARSTMSAKTGQEPTIAQLAEHLGVSADDVSEAICASQPALSLSPVYDGEKDSKEIDVPVSGEEVGLEDKIALKEVLSKMAPEQRQLIVLRYYQGKTQSETAKVLGTTQVQVSRMERRILKAIRCEMLM